MRRRIRVIVDRWPLAIAAAYATGRGLAAWAFAASPPLLMAGAPSRQLEMPEHAWMPWPALMAAALSACCLTASQRAFGPRRQTAAQPRAWAAALAARRAFPWLSGLLLPLLAALRAGLWTLLAWRMVGSALIVRPVARATRKLMKDNP
jgi:hypothetical protein